MKQPAHYPRISIVTPSFNQGCFLEQTIRSVINQRYPNLEYIIMDGGSTDNSLDIIEKYSDSIAHWESGQDNGQSAAIARGFSLATGEILGWLNSDDLLLPDSLSIVSRSFTPKDFVAVAGRCVYINSSGIPFRVAIPRSKSYRQMLLYGHGLAQMATFWTRQAFDSAGGLDTTLQVSFDYDLFVRLRKHGPIKILPHYLAAFRVHSSSKTSTRICLFRHEDNLIRRKHDVANFHASPLFWLFRQLAPIQRLVNLYHWHRDKKPFSTGPDSSA